MQAVAAADFELDVPFARGAVEAARLDRQLMHEIAHLDRLRSLGMDQPPVRPEPRRRPAVLVVDAALCRVEWPRRRVERPRAEIVEEADERRRLLGGGRLVGCADLERPELRMRADVPPEAGR